MISKPFTTLEKFTGMSADGGIFYADGFSVRKENGKDIIFENFKMADQIYANLSGFTELNANIISGAYTKNIAGNIYYKILNDTNNYLYSYADLSTNIWRGIVIKPSDLSLTASLNGDVFVLPSGNILWTLADYISLGVRGTCASGSDTTKIIDSSGRNFSTLGLSSSAPNNKVVNMKTGEMYTITSISTTNTTNDTLNFSAGTANNENEEFIAFVGNKFDLNNSLTVPHFNGQPSDLYWARQIKQYGDEFYILNGNYLAKIASDESTFESGYKQLPVNYQGMSFDVNADKILVSAVTANGDSYLLFWDGYSDGWNNILKIDSTAYSINAYKSGWVYMINGILYYTDGRQSIKLSEYSDNKSVPSSNVEPTSFNGIKNLNDHIYIAFAGNNYNRALPGVYVFQPNIGWSYSKGLKNGDEFNPCHSIFINPRLSSTLSIANRVEVGGSSTLSILNSNSQNTATTRSRSLVYLLDFKRKTKISEVELVLTTDLNQFNDILGGRKKASITVNVGTGKDGVFGFNQTNAQGTTTTVRVDGTLRTGQVGDVVQFLFSSIGGERSYITSIANAGESNETWTVSPAFSAVTPDATDIRIIKLRKTTNKTVYLDELDEPVRFPTQGFYSDKMFVEILVEGTSNAFNVNILDIKVYGE